MSSPTVVAVGGHESDGGRALRGLLAPEIACVAGGRPLHRCVSALRARGETVCVVPMTLGRDPELVADAGRTLLNLPAARRAGTLLARPFGTQDHLTGWLRSAATRVEADRAVLLTAPSGGPFTDADLFRIARLVRQYGRHRIVEVALTGGDPDPAEGVRRCRALGAENVVLLPAAWTLPVLPGVAHCAVSGPLLPAPAVAGVLRARVREAVERYARDGDDGVSRGIEAAHGHGYAHSHGPADHVHGPGDTPHGPGHHHHAQETGEDADAGRGDHRAARTPPGPASLVLPHDLTVHRSLR
ncbi:sirohydrochlorin chelatase [Streptomyces sp. P6-2-1]|uniref:sirohydrochlorin chelatase n=1 Tax=unclassified Streptomyces TaxID=2593676 RepID=UPI003D365688